jgi:hypothetical protein
MFPLKSHSWLYIKKYDKNMYTVIVTAGTFEP